ncbi:MAG: glycosyltransferase family 2 protein [Muribaculaceae bacterium]|nr:glycosyltransferase family 2 protein [Muribaculaceae bacterium]
MKKLAVIILNWNGLALLREFLPEAARHTISPEADLIVADNGSDDGSVEWVRENFPQVGVLELGRNYGFAEGYNHAIEATGYEYTLLLNSDVMVEQGWWQPLLRFMEANPQAGGCQPKIHSYREPGMFEYAGAAGGLLDRLGYPYCRGRMASEVEADRGQYDGAPAEVAWASGAALMVRTRWYREAGGLDPKFFAHMEEIDLCLRMRAQGHPVYALTDSAVRHVGGASLAQGNPQKTYLNFRNNLLLLHKNLPRSRGKRLLFFRRLMDTAALLMFLVKGDLPNTRAVLKAHRDFRRMKRDYKEFPAVDILSILPGRHTLVPLHQLRQIIPFRRHPL